MIGLLEKSLEVLEHLEITAPYENIIATFFLKSTLEWGS